MLAKEGVNGWEERTEWVEVGMCAVRHHDEFTSGQAVVQIE